MPDNLALVLAVSLGQVLPAGIAVYAGYWAFSIRKALAGRIYRNHALWLGAFCVPFAISSFITYSNSPIIFELIDVYFIVLILTVFAWVDSTIPVARRSDPLLRNILRWKQVRLMVWPVQFGLAAIKKYTLGGRAFGHEFVRRGEQGHKHMANSASGRWVGRNQRWLT